MSLQEHPVVMMRAAVTCPRLLQSRLSHPSRSILAMYQVKTMSHDDMMPEIQSCSLVGGSKRTTRQVCLSHLGGNL